MLIPYIIFPLFLSPFLSLDVAQISGATKQALSPSLHYGTRLQIYIEKNSALSSLVDSRRVVLTHATKRPRQLVSLEIKISKPGFESLTPNLVVFDVTHETTGVIHANQQQMQMTDPGSPVSIVRSSSRI